MYAGNWPPQNALHETMELLCYHYNILLSLTFLADERCSFILGSIVTLWANEMRKQIAFSRLHHAINLNLLPKVAYHTVHGRRSSSTTEAGSGFSYTKTAFDTGNERLVCRTRASGYFCFIYTVRLPQRANTRLLTLASIRLTLIICSTIIFECMCLCFQNKIPLRSYVP